MSKRGNTNAVKMILPIVLALGVTGLALGFVLDVIDDVGSGMTASSIAQNATNDTRDALADFADYFDTIVLVVVAVIIIAILLWGFGSYAGM